MVLKGTLFNERIPGCSSISSAFNRTTLEISGEITPANFMVGLHILVQLGVDIMLLAANFDHRTISKTELIIGLLIFFFCLSKRKAVSKGFAVISNLVRQYGRVNQEQEIKEYRMNKRLNYWLNVLSEEDRKWMLNISPDFKKIFSEPDTVAENKSLNNETGKLKLKGIKISRNQHVKIMTKWWPYSRAYDQKMRLDEKSSQPK
jgi:hypothetical protein